MTELVVEGLSVRYGRARALHEVSFVARSGQVMAVVGPNGAGKSSLVNAVYGAVSSTGSVRLDGEDLNGLSSWKRARTGVAIVPQGRHVFARLTVRENLQVMAEVLGLGRTEVEEALDRFPVLRERARQFAGVLSGGEQQMLAVTRALMARPRVLLYDEMLTGLAPIIVQQLMADARRLADEGTVVLLTEPAITAIVRFIDRGAVLLRGELVAEADSGKALLDRYQERIGMTASASAG